MDLDLFRNLWPYLVAVVSIAAAAAVTVDAVLRKRDTRAVIGWVGLAWLAPLAGSLAYLCFGINRIKRKAVSLQISAGECTLPPPREDEDDQLRDELLARCPNLDGLVALGGRVTGRPVVTGNRVDLLLNGEGAYPAMLEAIDRAERSVTLLSYLFNQDRVGERFVAALKSARARGVEVRVLIDHVGSRYSQESMVKRLLHEGVPVAAFLPTRRPAFIQYANLRNHRKILVVDGTIGFTGGTNIHEGHWLELAPVEPVQCAHFRFEGPVVAHLQRVFAIDWVFATGEALRDDRWFPALARSGVVAARGIPDGPDEDFEKISEVMLGAMATARQSIRVTSPYFIPDASIIRGLNVAALRGVAVKIVIPSKNNIALVQWATTAQLDLLLEKGCRVFTSAPPFDHTKLMVIDGVWSLVGSTNWDARSLRLNFEFNVECYNIGLAQQLEGLIDQKIAGGAEVTREALAARPFSVKLRDGLARLASPYL